MLFFHQDAICPAPCASLFGGDSGEGSAYAANGAENPHSPAYGAFFQLAFPNTHCYIQSRCDRASGAGPETGLFAICSVVLLALGQPYYLRLSG